MSPRTVSCKGAKWLNTVSISSYWFACSTWGQQNTTFKLEFILSDDNRLQEHGVWLSIELQIWGLISFNFKDALYDAPDWMTFTFHRRIAIQNEIILGTLKWVLPLLYLSLYKHTNYRMVCDSMKNPLYEKLTTWVIAICFWVVALWTEIKYTDEAQVHALSSWRVDGILLMTQGRRKQIGS